jgi:hypothetical protein
MNILGIYIMHKTVSFFIWFTIIGVGIALFLTYLIGIKLNSFGEVVLITFFVMLVGVPAKLWFDKVWNSFDDE